MKKFFVIFLFILLSTCALAQREISDKQIIEMFRTIIQIVILVYIIRFLLNILRTQLLWFKKEKK